MSYTNLDLVKKHIEFTQPIFDSIRDQLLICDSDAYNKFFNGSIFENSVKVKTINNSEPLKVTTTFTNNSVTIYSRPLVRNSVVCASDSSLGTIYVENVDFMIDYESAVCTLKPVSALSVGSEVTFFFIPYSLYMEGTDFRVDYASGEIQRITSGNIQLGETLYLDYIPLSVNYTDDILANAVVEANSIIEKDVDPNKEFGADLVLQTAATYRALEIICRSTAIRELVSTTKKENVSSWIKLSDLYLERANALLLTFKSPSKQLNKPTHS